MESIVSSSKMDTPTELDQSTSSGMNRFGIFQILVKNAFERVSSGVSEDSYVKLFGGLSALKKSKSAPMKMKKTMTDKLLKSLNHHLEEMVQEEKMKDKFDTLETLVEECALYEGRETWRPNGNVEDHVRSHVMDKKLKHKCTLEEYVREKEQVTEMRKQQVSDLRTQVREAERSLHELRDICLDTSIINKLDKAILDQAINLK